MDKSGLATLKKENPKEYRKLIIKLNSKNDKWV